MATSSVSAQGKSASVTKGVPTAGRVSNGAIIEKEIPFTLAQLETMKLTLRNPDFTTAQRIAQVINAHEKQPMARMLNNAEVIMTKPADGRDWVTVMADIEQLPVTPDQVARVVIDEKSGVIVMGEKVRLSTVAISQGNLTIKITETPQVSQPNAFSETGTTQVVDRTSIQVDEQGDRKVALMNSGVSLQELVQGLNALGVGPRDIISILQAIKAAGAMQAEIEVI